MSFRLVPLIKKTAPIIDLQRPILLIGRHMECDVRLDTPKISRRHCCVAMAYDRLLIRDLGSRNGVRLNGRVIEEAQLQSGDEVAIGPIVFRLEPLDDRPETCGNPSGTRRDVQADRQIHLLVQWPQISIAKTGFRGRSGSAGRHITRLEPTDWSGSIPPKPSHAPPVPYANPGHSRSSEKWEIRRTLTAA